MDFLSESVSTEDFQFDHQQYFNKWSGRISSVKFPMMAAVITKLLTKAKLSVLRIASVSSEDVNHLKKIQELN
jgi:hypothetical protein